MTSTFGVPAALRYLAASSASSRPASVPGKVPAGMPELASGSRPRLRIPSQPWPWRRLPRCARRMIKCATVRMPARPPVRAPCTECLVTRQRHDGRRYGDAHNVARIFHGTAPSAKDCLDSPSGARARVWHHRAAHEGSLRPRAILPGHRAAFAAIFGPNSARTNASPRTGER